MDQSLRAAVLRTLAFFNLFDRSLTPGEVRLFLHGAKAADTDLEPVLVGLQEERIIRREAGRVFLSGNVNVRPSAERERAEVADEYRRRAARFARIATKLPWVLGIYLVNSVALGTAKASSDIDMLVIVPRNRIWAARFLVTLLSQLLGVRVHVGDGKLAGRMCFSFYLARRALDLSQLRLSDGDVYLAYWIASATYVGGVIDGQELLRENAWVRDLLPNIPAPGEAVPGRTKRVSRFLDAVGIGALTEFFARTLLRGRTLRRIASLGPTTGAVVNDRMQKLHDVDKRPEFHRRWVEECRTLDALDAEPVLSTMGA